MILLRVVGIVQARTGSKRLRNKTVLSLGSRTILGILLERISASKIMDQVVVATTTQQRDDIVERIALECGFQIFRGSEDDVLDRYYNAARTFAAGVIVRITADNPLTDAGLADSQVRHLIENDCDYVTTRNVLLGVGSEAVSFRSLQEAWRSANQRYQREHVTPYIYENADQFKVRYMTPPAFLKQQWGIRLTIDTNQDLELYAALQNYFGDLVPVDIRDVVSFLTRTPEIREINMSVRQKDYRELGS